MRVGVTLPQFRRSPEDAIAAAVAAERVGIDGVFVFDHLWAIGQPERPALNCWPLLGALAASTSRVTLGTLVARVSLLPDAVLAHNVETVCRIVGADRFVAGLGAGDRLSEPENEAYGIAFPPLDERMERLADCVRRVRTLGVAAWVGGLSDRVRKVALAEGVPLNVWGVDAARVAAERELGLEVTWGGVLAAATSNPTDPSAVAALLDDLRAAGASWAVCAPAYVDGEPPDAAVEVVASAIGRAVAGITASARPKTADGPSGGVA
ncbi:MAG TPA: LLM class flavin-dependent oxidoreductase [Acidimicrobiales bacterium]